MRPACILIRHLLPPIRQVPNRRNLLTLAIETSCDDTCVAVLEKHKNNSATLYFNEKITSDNREYRGVYPIKAHHSHQEKLAVLVNAALQSLPIQRTAATHLGNSLLIQSENGVEVRKKPNFVSVTRGPGMRANLITGLDTAKGLAVAWQVPFVGVNHMQAHALTPRLVSSLNASNTNDDGSLGCAPRFPFLSLLVSGGNTMLVNSTDLCEHEILAQSIDLAIGDMLDKCARDILPEEILASAPDVSYARILEQYAFPEITQPEDYGYAPPNRKGVPRRLTHVSSTRSRSVFSRDWSISAPLSKGDPKRTSETLATMFAFSGIGSQVKRIVEETPAPGLNDIDRRVLARETMRVAFEHLASRVIFALEKSKVIGTGTLVVSGGVASNQYLKHIFRTILDADGFENVTLLFPPPSLCTDNAAMIGWTGLEMWEAGYRSDLEVRALAKWTIDPNDSGGILGVDGWIKVAA